MSADFPDHTLHETVMTTRNITMKEPDRFRSDERRHERKVARLFASYFSCAGLISVPMDVGRYELATAAISEVHASSEQYFTAVTSHWKRIDLITITKSI